MQLHSNAKPPYGNRKPRGNFHNHNRTLTLIKEEL